MSRNFLQMTPSPVRRTASGRNIYAVKPPTPRQIQQTTTSQDLHGKNKWVVSYSHSGKIELEGSKQNDPAISRVFLFKTFASGTWRLASPPTCPVTQRLSIFLDATTFRFNHLHPKCLAKSHRIINMPLGKGGRVPTPERTKCANFTLIPAAIPAVRPIKSDRGPQLPP